VPKSERAEWRVSLDEYKGKQVIDVRVWYQFQEGAERSATRRGVTFDVKRLPELREALQTAEAELLKPGGAT
jgi:hypothetical protein